MCVYISLSTRVGRKQDKNAHKKKTNRNEPDRCQAEPTRVEPHLLVSSPRSTSSQSPAAAAVGSSSPSFSKSAVAAKDASQVFPSELQPSAVTSIDDGKSVKGETSVRSTAEYVQRSEDINAKVH